MLSNTVRLYFNGYSSDSEIVFANEISLSINKKSSSEEWLDNTNNCVSIFFILLHLQLYITSFINILLKKVNTGNAMAKKNQNSNPSNNK